MSMSPVMATGVNTAALQFIVVSAHGESIKTSISVDWTWTHGILSSDASSTVAFVRHVISGIDLYRLCGFKLLQSLLSTTI